MDYELKTTHYQGPLDKLLELVEEKKLEITLVSLASVTANFLEYIKKLEASPHNRVIIADFLVIASKLILIKSKILIPSLELEEEEKADIKDLERRLKIYQELKITKDYVRAAWNPAPKMIAREFLMNAGFLFYPPKTLNPEKMHQAFIKSVGELQKILKPRVVIKTKIISLRIKIEEILKRLTETPISFKNLQKGHNRDEIVTIFLAILHLIREELIHVIQDKHFDEITVAKKPPIN
jgi:segregation and condensation protein A